MPTLVEEQAIDSSSASVSELSVTFDAAPSENNMLLAMVCAQFSPGTVTPPSGWTLEDSYTSGPYCYVYSKVAGASEPASYTWSWTGSRKSSLIVRNYRGNDTSTPIDVQVSGGGSGTSLSTGTTATIASGNAVAEAWFGVQSTALWDGGQSFTNSYSAETEIEEPGSAPAIYIARNESVTPGGTTETTMSTTDTGGAVWGWLVVFDIGPLTAGTVSLTDRTSTTADLSSTDAAGGSLSYTYQWHRSTTSGFTPGVGTQVAGATSLTLSDSGLSDGTTYYYVLEYDDGVASPVYSDEYSVTASNSPLVVITDFDGNTSGTTEIMGPNTAWFKMTSSILGSGNWWDSKVEWDFGDSGSDFNEHRGFAGAHFYDAEPVSNTDYTVTCTITNSAGLSSSATRTVRVTPNTRRVVYVNSSTGSASPTDPSDPGDPYDTIANCITGETLTDLEVRMQEGQTHVLGTAFGGSTASNCLLRSTTNGVKWNATAAVGELIDGGENIAMRDINVTGSTNGAHVVMLDQRSQNPYRCYLVDCDADDNEVAGLSTDTTSRGTLLQNVTTNGVDAGADYWLPGAEIVLHNVNSVDFRNNERPFRCSGSLLTMTQCSSEYQDTNGKSAMTKSGGTWVYIDQCTFEVGSDATNSSSHCLKIGHNIDDDVQNVVVERCQMTMRTTQALVSEATLYLGSTGETFVHGIAVRNCIMTGARVLFQMGTTDTDTLDDVSFLHNTVQLSSAAQDHLTLQAKYGSSLIANNLFVDYSSKAQVVSIVDSTVGDNDPVLNNNVFPPANADDDVRVDGAASRDDWATFNASALGSGNLSKSISYNAGTYRPDDTGDSDILFAAPTEMGAVPEDYYGNPRSGLYVAGAVDAAASSATSNASSIGDTAFLAAYLQMHGMPKPQLDITPQRLGVTIDTSGISQPGVMPNG